MISAGLLAVVQCPDCGRAIERGAEIRCVGCGRVFSAPGFLDLRPAAAFREQTRYLDESLHADARHESISPPVLGSKIRNDMLRTFLAPGPADRIVDLGCGSGRALAWNADRGASMVGVDISEHFAREAIDRWDLVLGDLRRLPLRSGAFTKAWSLDVLEHLSPDALRDTLAEAHRVLADNGQLFVYTHVRKNGWIAKGVRVVNLIARAGERVGLIDLRQERLRKSDHLNPLTDHDHLARVLAESGFRLERITYYTPIVGAFVENVIVRIAERMLVRGVRRRQGDQPDDAAAVRAVRSSAQARVQRRGATYRGLVALSALMKLDVWLFGRIRSGPFFALLRKAPPRRSPQAT
jgi:SAM-dependent methyltransferase